VFARDDLFRVQESATKIDDEDDRADCVGLVASRAGNDAATREAWGEKLKQPEFEDWGFWFEWAEVHLRLRDADKVVEKNRSCEKWNARPLVSTWRRPMR